MRVAIVNDMKLAVEALKRALQAAPGVDVAWIAENGLLALEACRRDTPDVVLMDLLMPVMDGVESTRRILAECATTVIVVTSTVDGNASRVFQAMGCGALDAVPTPTLGPSGRVLGAEPLLESLLRVAKLASPRTALPAPLPPEPVMQTGENPPLILLGASTGGPPAISEVLENLGTGTRAAVVIVQHLDARFSNGLAVWLSEQPNVMPVALAAEGMRPTAGRALLTASNDHLTMRQDLTLAYDPEPRDYPYRPSVDVLFHAASRYWPTLGAAALLTGMGRDGAQGLLALRQAGWLTLAQDEASSALYGMPKAAADIGAASEILAPREIGLRLVRWSLSNAAMQRSKGSNHERTKRT